MFLPLLAPANHDIVAVVNGHSVIHIGSMTKGLRSVSGTTTHGGRDSTLPGNYSVTSGQNVDGLFAQQSTGPPTVVRHTKLDTTGAQFTGTPATVYVSIDGTNWYPFQWKDNEDNPGVGDSAYFQNNNDGYSGDPFNLWAMVDGTVSTVYVAVN